MSGRQRQRVNTAKNERNGVHVMYRNDEGTVTVRELDAITWAAKNAGVSYGVFAMSLKPEQYKGIFESYCEEVLRRKREEQAWLRSNPAAKSKRPGMREDI